MSTQQQQKIVQYLNEAHGSELALVRQLQAQVAMTPSGQYRDGLETHLDETRRHASRIERRLGELGQGSNPLQVGLGLVQSVIGQALALTKTPVDLVRGSGGEEKVLKNAKDSCAAEAQEIATYTALARLARNAGDRQDRAARQLGAGRRAADARPAAEGDPAADRRRGQRRVRRRRLLRRDRDGRRRRRPRGRQDGQAHSPPEHRPGQADRPPGPQGAGRGACRGHGQGGVASESDLAIAGYDSLSVDEIIGKLAELSQVDLAKVNAYERKHQNRSTVTGRIDSLQADEPWPGYDELGVDEVRAVLGEGDESTHQGRSQLRAQAQEPRRRPAGHRARAGQQLASRPMFLFTKRPGERTQLRFMPGCLVMSPLRRATPRSP